MTRRRQQQEQCIKAGAKPYISETHTTTNIITYICFHPISIKKYPQLKLAKIIHFHEVAIHLSNHSVTSFCTHKLMHRQIPITDVVCTVINNPDT